MAGSQLRIPRDEGDEADASAAAGVGRLQALPGVGQRAGARESFCCRLQGRPTASERTERREGGRDAFSFMFPSFLPFSVSSVFSCQLGDGSGVVGDGSHWHQTNTPVIDRRYLKPAPRPLVFVSTK